MTPTFIHGNALSIPLADKSVHLICTSPPYFALRSYRDDGEHFDGQLGSEETPLHFLIALWAVLDECWRVLRDDGSCWINLGDKFAGSGGHNNAGVGGSGRGPGRYNQATAGLLDKSQMMLPHLFAAGCQYPWLRRAIEAEAGVEPAEQPRQWIMRKEVIWAKTNHMPESVTDRVQSAHEQWFHLVKQGTYFAAMDEIRQEADTADRKGDRASYRPGSSSSMLGAEHASKSDAGLPLNPLGKVPGSWWAVSTEPLRPPKFMVPAFPGDMHPLWLEKPTDAQRWMTENAIHSSPWPRQPEDGKQLRVAPSHFAAFPSEFPRRIVLGWSPSGVCVECGNPRRPVVEKQRTKNGQPVHDAPAIWGADGKMGDVGRGGHWRWGTDRKHTGYACSCPTPDAPTRPSVVLDPFSGTGTTAVVAAALGRHGIGVELSADYLRLAEWRQADGRLAAKVTGRKAPKKKPAKVTKLPEVSLSLFDMLAEAG